MKSRGTLEIWISFGGNGEKGRSPWLPKQTWLILSQQRVVDMFIKFISSGCKKNAEALSTAEECWF